MTVSGAIDERILETLQSYWGYDTLRPRQHEAIEAELAGRDSLVVLPTGGGKSLCYQIPPAVAGRLDIVVSPLISLMKDQVDGLLACGYPAAALHSGIDYKDVRQIEQDARDGHLHLLFMSPERLLSPGGLSLIQRLDIRAFAIDEAHCISQWGHDFRPEYRQMRSLRDYLPKAALHAYTATATERVREDIVRQLGLDDPAVLVGRFDRPNLTYRIIPRIDLNAQIIEVLKRHPKQAAIVYCMTRKETEQTASVLSANGFSAAPYHAGLSPEERKSTQDDFTNERIDVVAATVAFGMGIDRSNVRCVIHAAMPKSIEHYQQETGRAGRDGLDAECVLFYSPADAMKWERLLHRSAMESAGPVSEKALESQLATIRDMQKFAGTPVCRHRSLTEHFGQTYESDDCGACDVCLGELEGAVDVTVEAQKILSCVYRMGRGYGVGYLVEVLAGADTEMVRQRGHLTLSTYGILSGMPRKALTRLVYELVDQGVLDRTQDDRPVLVLNETSAEVLRGGREVRVQRAPTKAVRTSKVESASWEGVDRELFERLRELRKHLASERGVPPYVVFNDETLRTMAAHKPTTTEGLLEVKGVGPKKLREYGDVFLEEIRR